MSHFSTEINRTDPIVSSTNFRGNQHIFVKDPIVSIIFRQKVFRQSIKRPGGRKVVLFLMILLYFRTFQPCFHMQTHNIYSAFREPHSLKKKKYHHHHHLDCKTTAFQAKPSERAGSTPRQASTGLQECTHTLHSQHKVASKFMKMKSI